MGAYVGHTSASIEVGDPGFPELSGKETGAELVWRLDTQDSPVVPVGGLRSEVRLSHIFNRPDLVVEEQTITFDSSLTQLSASANQFWSIGPRNRVFVSGASARRSIDTAADRSSSRSARRSGSAPTTRASCAAPTTTS